MYDDNQSAKQRWKKPGVGWPPRIFIAKIFLESRNIAREQNYSARAKLFYESKIILRERHLRTQYFDRGAGGGGESRPAGVSSSPG